MKYPHVMNEFETIEEVIRNERSLARFGDGELKLMLGHGQVREPPNEALADELVDVLVDANPKLLSAIPRIFKESPKYAHWKTVSVPFARLTNPQLKYGSAFVTRPDSAPEINNNRFATLIQSIWKGKKILLVSENEFVKIHRLITVTEKSFIDIRCPHEQTYAVLDDIERKILKHSFDVALLSCGPAATCLAARLTRRNIRAIDIGSAGKFIQLNLAIDIPKLRPSEDA